MKLLFIVYVSTLLLSVVENPFHAKKNLHHFAILAESKGKNTIHFSFFLILSLPLVIYFRERRRIISERLPLTSG